MNIFLFQPQQWDRLYNNCSHIDAQPLPWEQRRYTLLSCLIIALCVFYSILYIPCIFSLKRHLRDDRGRSNPCFIILVYISIVDLVCIWSAGFMHGFLYLIGAVYCTYPALSFWTGLIGTNFAHAEIMADVVLALNRCIDILSPELAIKMFRGKRVWLWLFPCTAFGIYTFLHEMPLVYNGLFFGWFTNPYEGFFKVPPDTFKSYLCVFACLVLVFGTSIIYALFLAAFYIKYLLFNDETMHRDSLSKMQKSIFLQVFLISLFNILTGGIFFLMNQFPALVTSTTIIIGHFAWFHIHGIPPVIYICFNKTLRNDCKKVLLKLAKMPKWGQIGNAGSTTIHPAENQQINPIKGAGIAAISSGAENAGQKMNG